MQIARAHRNGCRSKAGAVDGGRGSRLRFALLLCGTIRESRADADCSITAVSLNFGAYDPVATAPDDSAGTVTVTCRTTTKSATRVNYTVAIANGMYGATATARTDGCGRRPPGLQRVHRPGPLAGLGHGNAAVR